MSALPPDCVAKVESCSASDFSRKQEAGDDRRFVYPLRRRLCTRVLKTTKQRSRRMLVIHG